MLEVSALRRFHRSAPASQLSPRHSELGGRCLCLTTWRSASLSLRDSLFSLLCPCIFVPWQISLSLSAASLSPALEGRPLRTLEKGQACLRGELRSALLPHSQPGTPENPECRWIPLSFAPCCLPLPVFRGAPITAAGRPECLRGLPAPLCCPEILGLLHPSTREKSKGKSLWVSETLSHCWGSLEFPSVIITAHASSHPSPKNENGCESLLRRTHHLFLCVLFEDCFTLYSSNISSGLEVESSFDKNTFYTK